MPWHVSQNRKPEIMNYAEKDNLVLSFGSAERLLIIFKFLFFSVLMIVSNSAPAFPNPIKPSDQSRNIMNFQRKDADILLMKICLPATLSAAVAEGTCLAGRLSSQ